MNYSGSLRTRDAPPVRVTLTEVKVEERGFPLTERASLALKVRREMKENFVLFGKSF